MPFVTANQTTDIWNISGRVNHQDGPVTSEPQRWPTHDHHVSLDSFVIPETHQHNKKDRIPPPPYSEGIYLFAFLINSLITMPNLFIFYSGSAYI